MMTPDEFERSVTETEVEEKIEEEDDEPAEDNYCAEQR